MRRGTAACTFLLLLSFLAMPLTASAATLPQVTQAEGISSTENLPMVSPRYIYDQLDYMATHFQHREAGYDTGPTDTYHGHDAFATYWTQEIERDLQGFGVQAQRDLFPIKGWIGRPAVVSAYNVEVTVPGALHPEQEVIIGCHYDGEAISTQSANDDASGCAIELGIAKALGDYWRSNHLAPARTLRFVIFDAEEQGLFGSYHYVNSTVNGDLSNIVAMFNEEQSGIAYPLRYLGQLSNPLMPFYADLTPLQNNQLYPAISSLSSVQRAQIQQFHALMQQAAVAVFQQFRAAGYQGLTYHGNNGQNVAEPIFTPDQLNNIHIEDDTLGSSDQMPFTMAGIPCATFVGNSNYYDANQQPAYPYDQAQDTIQLMNTYADGSALRSNALMLALALPGQLTLWMLHQPAILGDTPQPGHPIAAISDIGVVQPAQTLNLNAAATWVPANNHSPIVYRWNFGDGTQASGITVSHSYRQPGNYLLTLNVSSTSGQSTIQKMITVTDKPATYTNPYVAYPSNGVPPSNPNITYPTPNNALMDSILSSMAANSSGITMPGTQTGNSASSTTLVLPITIVGGLILLIAIVFVLLLRRQRLSEKKS
jgi:hypothetical protein